MAWPIASILLLALALFFVVLDWIFLVQRLRRRRQPDHHLPSPVLLVPLLLVYIAAMIDQQDRQWNLPPWVYWAVLLADPFVWLWWWRMR